MLHEEANDSSRAIKIARSRRRALLELKSLPPSPRCFLFPRLVSEWVVAPPDGLQVYLPPHICRNSFHCNSSHEHLPYPAPESHRLRLTNHNAKPQNHHSLSAPLQTSTPRFLSPAQLAPRFPPSQPPSEHALEHPPRLIYNTSADNKTLQRSKPARTAAASPTKSLRSLFVSISST